MPGRGSRRSWLASRPQRSHLSADPGTAASAWAASVGVLSEQQETACNPGNEGRRSVNTQQPGPIRGLTPEYPMSLGVFDTYQQAQRVVDFLSDNEFPV